MSIYGLWVILSFYLFFELLKLCVFCVDSQYYFSVNHEETSVYTKPEPEQQEVTKKVTPEPFQPKPSPEPKVAPQKPAAPEPKTPKMKPEAAKKKPEAPEARGKVVQLERHCVIQYVCLVLFYSVFE